jgi:hypothetical protein
MTKPTSSLDGLHQSQSQFASVQDELRDIKRVHTQGQEEDLKMALGRAITRIEELVSCRPCYILHRADELLYQLSMLMEQYTVQTEIQTELTLSKSNLQLALANNEMLEEALKRDTSGRGKDLGWRRQQQFSHDMDRSSTSSEVDRQSIDPPTSSDNGGVNQDSRFFRFRFGGSGSGRNTPQVSQAAQNGILPNHLVSASLPVLVPSREKEMEDLTSELERERKAHNDTVHEKKKLEEELESLSQALFEEVSSPCLNQRIRFTFHTGEQNGCRGAHETCRCRSRAPPNT